MTYRFSIRQRLVAIAAVAAFCACAPALAQLAWLAPFGAAKAQPGIPQAASPVALGALAEQRGDLAAAAGHYELALKQALALASNLSPQMRTLVDEQLRSILPRYARVAIALGRLADAELALENLRALPPPPAPPAGAGGIAEARHALGAAFAMAAQGAHGISQRLIVDGEAGDSLDAALRPRLPATEWAAVLLAELRARQGRTDDVLSLWQSDVRPQLQATSKQTHDLLMPRAEEAAVAGWHMALALHAAGHAQAAREALGLAMALDAARLRQGVETIPLLEAQFGGLQRHRWMAATAVELALARQAGGDADPAMARFALGAVASSKGLANRVATRRHALVTADPQLRTARSDLARLDAELLDLPTEGETGLRAWVEWSNRQAAAMAPLMPALARAGLGGVIAAPDELVARVPAALAPGEVVVGFVLLRPAAAAGLPLPPTRYVRYTFSASGIGWRDLGESRAIDRLVSAWRMALSTKAQHAQGQALSAALLPALPDDVARSKRWVVDPDGLLALLPFEALPAAGGEPMVAMRSIRYVTSLAHLAETTAEASAVGRTAPGPAWVVADPAFALRPRAVGAAVSALRDANGRAWRDMVFSPLPETRKEAEAVQQGLAAMRLEVRELSGAQATPEALRRLQAPAVLHVASHGFVLAPIPAADALSSFRLRMVVPGLLAGLALAPDSSGTVLSGTDLAAMNLRGTRLVVLSACDTGNGSIDTHEGLTSLRRAAEEAGAAATLTSLWPVPSQATVALMSAFYAALAAGGDHAEALRTAKLQVMRGGGAVGDWAGFVLAGALR